MSDENLMTAGDRCVHCDRTIASNGWTASGLTVREFREANPAHAGSALHANASDSRPADGGEGWLLTCSETCDRAVWPWEY